MESLAQAEDGRQLVAAAGTLGCGNRFVLRTPRHRPPTLSRIRSSQVVCGDSETLPFRTPSFDRVLCLNAMHHMPNVGNALREIVRVLSADGRAVFAEPGVGHSRQPHAIRAVQEFGVQEADIDAAEFLQHCKAAGFPFVASAKPSSIDTIGYSSSHFR